jgi:hypothetical protein
MAECFRLAGVPAEVLDRARELWGDEGTPPILAYEGMELDLTADTATAALQQVVAHSESLVRHTGARPRYRRYLANARSGTA